MKCQYSWLWQSYGDDANQLGEILEANETDFFQLTFLDPIVVSVRMIEEHGTNLVELVQTNIELDENSRKKYFVGCGDVWIFYLANLKSILEGGIDLRNKDENIKSVVNS
jgi:hypothetical protein